MRAGERVPIHRPPAGRARLACILVCLLAALALLVLAPPAGATETRGSNFDSFSDGQTLTNQVAGITFPSARVFTPSASRTSTPPRALRNPLDCNNSTCTNGAYQLRFNFDRLAKVVSLKAGDVLVGCFEFDCPSARLVGYGSANNVVAASPLTGIPSSNDPSFPAIKIDRQITIDAGAFVIDHAILYVGKDDYGGEYAGTPRTAQIDDLSAFMLSPGDIPPPPDTTPPPTVAISAPPEGENLETPDAFVSGSATAAAGVVAFCVAANTATMPVPCDQAARLRPDASIPNRYSFSNFWLRDLVPGSNTISAWIQDGRGRVAHATRTVRVLTPADAVDLRALSLDVTQGVQAVAPLALDDATPGTLVGEVPGPHPIADYPDAGVTLVRHKPTVVRLQAGVASFGRLSATRIRRVSATLRGFRPNRRGHLEELPGSPLTASPMDLTATAVDRLRAAPGGSYSFTLPQEWVARGLTLIGEVNPPGIHPRVAECAGCDTNNAFGMRNVGITRHAMKRITVTPIMLFTPTAHPPPSDQVYRDWQRLSPLPITVQPYRGFVDVSHIVATTSGDERGDELIQVVEDWEDDHEVVSDTRKVIGVHQGLDAGLSQDSYSFIFDFQEAVAEVDGQRPLTSAAHELGHQLDLEHAGTKPSCYNRQAGESWPDGDSAGSILGYGLDTTPGSGSRGDVPAGERGPFDVFGSPMPGVFDPDPAVTRPARYFDLMSYCANINADISADPTADDTWLSTRYWDRLVSNYARSRLTPRTSAARAKPEPTLTVSGRVTRAGAVSIERVEPGPGTPNAAPANPPLTIVVRNASGAVVSSTGVSVQVLTRHDGTDTAEGTFLGEVPARGASLVQVLQNGTLVAERARSPHAPKVRVRCPGSVAGKGQIRLRWSARDADGGALTHSVDYSANGGGRWDTIAAGLTSPSLRLPKRILSASGNARLRIRAGDGFNEGQGRSCRFRAAGAGPGVEIISLDRRTALDGNLTVALSGQAFDDRGKPVAAKQLRWLSSGHPVARGDSATVPAALLGRRLTLTATDYHGRRGSASVSLLIKRPKPLFLELSASRTRPVAHVLRLRVASSVPARLRIGGKGVTPTSTSLGSRTRRLRVPIAPGRHALRLHARLAAHGKATDAVLVVTRR